MAELDELLKLVAAIRERTKDPTAVKQLTELDKRLRAFGTKAPPDNVTRVEPLELARSFRTVIEDIQTEARQAEVAGVTIKSMDLEVKALVEAAPGATRLVLPSPSAQVDAASLSTLRVSFGVVPALPQAPVPAEDAPSTKGRASPG